MSEQTMMIVRAQHARGKHRTAAALVPARLFPRAAIVAALLLAPTFHDMQQVSAQGTAPTVSAGDDQRVDEESAVTLNGVITGSGALTYEWAQIASASPQAALVTNGLSLTNSTGTPAAGVANATFTSPRATDRRGNGQRDITRDRYFFRLVGRSTTSGQTIGATDTVMVTVYPPRGVYVTGGYPGLDVTEGTGFSAIATRRDGVESAAGIDIPLGAGIGPSRGADCPADKEGGSAPEDFTFTGRDGTQFDQRIVAAQLAVTWNYTVVDDSIPENTECLGFGFALHNNANADTCCSRNWTIEYEEGFIQNARIIDNDTITVGWQTTAVTVSEGAGTATLNAVIVSPASGDAIERDDFNLRYFTVSGEGTASGDDFTAVTPTVTLGANLRTVAVTVPIVDDNMIEDDETFSVRISTASDTPLLTAIGAADTVTVTIDDNDFPTPRVGITPNRANFNEGDTDAEFTVTLTGGDFGTAAPVHFRVTGTAITTGDYDITAPAGVSAMSSTGTVTLTTHATDTEGNPVSGTIGLTITDDGAFPREDAETLVIEVWTDGSEVSRTSVTIAADPLADRFVAFGAATASGAEDAEIAIPVELTGIAPAQDVTVPVTAAPGSGDNPAETGDYELLTRMLTFSATGTQNVRLRIVQDAVNESTETVLIAFGEITNGGGGGGTVSQPPDSVTVSIAQSDPVTYSITAAPDPAPEDGELTVTVGLSAQSEGDVSVALTELVSGVVGGRRSLLSGEFSGVPPSVTVAAGASSTEFRVNLIDDSLVEADESFSVLPGDITRSAEAGAATAAGSAPIVRITDNDNAWYAITALETSVSEGGDAQFNISLRRQSDNALVTAPGDVVAPWSASVSQANSGDANTQARPDIAGGDGAATAAGEATIAAGQTSATITLSIASDQLAEDDETLTVTLGTPPTLTSETGVVRRSPTDDSAQVTIPENTAASRILTVARISGSGPLQESGAGADLYRLMLDIPSGGTATEAITVNWRLSTATVGANANPAEAADFTTSTGAVTFDAGAAAGTSATVSLQLVNDMLNEGEERFSVEWELNPANPDVALPLRLDATIAIDTADTIALSRTGALTVDLACEETSNCGAVQIVGTPTIDATDDIRLSFTFGSTGGVGGAGSITFSSPDDPRPVQTGDLGRLEFRTGDSGQLTFDRAAYNTPGLTAREVWITADPLDDLFNEGTQTVTLDFTGGESAGAVNVGNIARMMFRIRDDDPTTVTVSSAPAANEGDYARFPVEFTGGIPTRDVEIDWEVALTGATAEAEDFDRLTGTETIRIAFPAGLADAVTTGVVRVPIAQDADDEEDRFILRLTAARGAGGSGISVASASTATAVINRLDRSPPRFADPDAQPGWTAGQQVLWVRMSENFKVLPAATGANAPADAASLTTLNAGDFTVVDNQGTPSSATIAVTGVTPFPDETNPSLRLALASPIAADGASVEVAYGYTGGNAIYDRALESGLAGPEGRNRMTQSSVVLTTRSTNPTADADGDGIPDAAEARISGDAGNPFADVTDAQQPVLSIRRTASRNPVAYSGIRAHGVRAHLGVFSIPALTTQTAARTITAYYRSDTFGYDGAYQCAGASPFPANYAAPLAEGGCAPVDWGNIAPSTNHRIAWLARSADGVWNVDTNTDSNLPEQVIWRIPELNMDAQSRFTSGGIVIRASLDAAPGEMPLTLSLTRTPVGGTATTITTDGGRMFAVTRASAESAEWEIAGLANSGGASRLYRPGTNTSVYPAANQYSLGLVRQTRVTRINVAVPPLLGRVWLAFSTVPNDATHVLRDGQGQNLYVVVENNDDIGAGTSVMLSDNGVLNSSLPQNFVSSISAYPITLNVNAAASSVTDTAVFQVTVTGGFGGVTTATYRFPVRPATHPLAQSAVSGRDSDDDGIIDDIDDFDDSDHLPVVVDEEAGASAWHHIRPALPVHDLRLGEATAQRLSSATAVEQVNDYAEYSASSVPEAESGLAVVYDFEIGGVDYAEVTAEGRTGGAAAVIIPLPRSLYAGGASLVKYPSNEAFSLEGGNDYGFAALQEDGACPDDTMAAGSPYREGETLRRAKRGGDACLVVYIVDGGPNDEDGLANGIIKDPLGVRAGNLAGGGSRSHSGAFGPLALAALLLLLLAALIKPSRRAPGGANGIPALLLKLPRRAHARRQAHTTSVSAKAGIQPERRRRA